jgi:hypothetical protein
MKEITVMKKIKKVKKEIFQADYYKIVKIKSQDFTQIQSPFISQNLPSINKSANLLQNYFFIKKITS